MSTTDTAADGLTTLTLGPDYPELRDGVRKICADFPGVYWRELDEASDPPRRQRHQGAEA